MKIATVEFIKSAPSLKDCPAGDLPEIALAGRSNVGKSSFLNKIVNRKKIAKVSNTPGRTQALNYFLINSAFYLVDLPGYGYAKVPLSIRGQWGQAIENYLLKRENLKAVVQLLDIRHTPSSQDVSLYEWLTAHNIPPILVATKADKIPRGQLAKNIKAINNALGLKPGNRPVIFSSQTGQGVDEAWGAMGACAGLGDGVVSPDQVPEGDNGPATI